MNYKYVIDNCLDDREFRNLVNTTLSKNGFISLGFDDVFLSDNDQINNNDILVKKGHTKYTVQTFLNKNINIEQINETLDDMENENVNMGIIVTNKEVSAEIKEIARQRNIEIWDKNKLLSFYEK